MPRAQAPRGVGAAVLHSDTPVTLRLAASLTQVDFHLLLPGATRPSCGPFRNRMGLPFADPQPFICPRPTVCEARDVSPYATPCDKRAKWSAVSSPQIETQLWMTRTCSVLSGGALHVGSIRDPSAEAHTVPTVLSGMSEGSRWPVSRGGCTLEPRGLPPGPSCCPAQLRPLDVCVNLPSSVSG